MKNLRYPANRLTLHKLVHRKIRQWNKIDYVSDTESKSIREKYADKRWSATIPVRTLLFLATSILLLGGTYLISLLITDDSPFVLLIIGILTLIIYEAYVGIKYHHAGIDKAFILVGGLLLFISVMVLFDDYKIKGPGKFLISAIIIWLIAIRYHNYIAYYSSFVLLQIYFFELIQLEFPFLVYILVSIVSTLCFAFYFYRKRNALEPYAVKWNETLEVFYLLMLVAFLNPKIQESLYIASINKSFDDSISYFDEFGLFLMIFISALFAATLMILGVVQQIRAYIIVAICTVFIGFYTIWHYYLPELNENLVYTIGGVGLMFLGLFLNFFLKTPRWNLTSKKIAHQNDLTKIFESFRKFGKKGGLNN